jgi:hypothetical protein
VIEWEINTVNKRPELQFDLQSEQIEISKNTISKVIYPKSMLLRRQVMETRTKHARQFIQTFYSVQRHWNVFDWDKSKKEKKLLISEAIVTTEKKLSYSIPIFNWKWKMKSLNYSHY